MAAALDDPRDSGGIVAVAFVGLHLQHAAQSGISARARARVMGS
jgi:hypothetical protein